MDLKSWRPARVYRAVFSAGMAILAMSCGGSDVPTGLEEELIAATVVLSDTTVTFTSLDETLQLSATILDQNGSTLPAATVSWSSSDDLVATVTAAGVVTAASNGSATITATSGPASATVDVIVAQAPQSLVVDPDPIVLNGPADSVRAVARVLDALGSEVPGQTVTWSTLDPAVATVDAGLVTAVAVGTTSIGATSGTLSVSVSATVTQTPASISLSPGSLDFESLGDTATVAALVLDSGGGTIANASVTWSSSNPSVATVVGGLVTSVGVGNATITGTAGPVSDQMTVSVVQVPDSVTVSPDPIVLNGPGDAVTAVAVVRDAGGFEIAGQTVTWLSADPGVVTAAAGLVTAVGVGSTTVTASSGSLSTTVMVSVTATPASVVLSADSVTLSGAGDTISVDAQVLDAGGNEIPNAQVTWSSSDSAVVTVTDGLITAASTGTATVTATAGAQSSTVVVTVEQPGGSGPSFSQVVNEILVRRGCAAGNCHGGDAGGLTLTTVAQTNYDNLVNVPSNDQPALLLVKPGDADNSYLIRKLDGSGSGARMPIGGGPLSSTDLNNIKDWINSGAPNN